jgi:hypothetical protein
MRHHVTPLALGSASTSLLIAALGLSGCAMGTIVQSGAAPSASVSGAALQGAVHGGTQPISGATIQLYAAGQPATPTSGIAVGGYGQGATALLTPGSMTVGSSNNYYPHGAGTGATCAYTTGNTNHCTALPQTDANGGFSVSGDYMCSSSAQVYIVATGGNPGLSGTVNNPYIALMAGLGSCGAAQSDVILLNEVTTVAAVWSLQQFLAAPDGTHAASAYASQGGSYSGVGVNIGASSGPVGGYGPDHVQSQQGGLSNAFRMINNLATNSTGLATPVNTWATPYSAKINAIANILAYCINSDGVTTNNCSTLMGDATVNSVTPQDTIQAAYMMAKNPFNQANTLVGLGSPSGPFQPSLSSVNDLSIEVGLNPTFTSGTNIGAHGFYSTSSISIDEMGRVWVYNSGTASANNAGLTGNYIAEVDANGAALAGPFQSYTVSGGYPYTGTTCTSATVHTLAGNLGMAIDQNGYLWAANELEGANCGVSALRSILRLDTDTATLTNGYYVSGTAGAPTVDASNDVWILGSSSILQVYSGNTGSSVTYANSGSAKYGNGVTSAAADTKGNVWLLTGANCTGSAGLLNQALASSYASPTVTYGIYTSGDAGCVSGTNSLTTTATIGGLQSIATDANNGIWATGGAATDGTSTVTYFAPQSAAWTNAVSTSTTIPTTGVYTSSAGLGGLSSPYGVSVDGANHAWIMNGAVTGTNSGIAISELAVALATDGTNNLASSPIASAAGSNGFLFPAKTTPFPATGGHSTAIDPSGNVWLANGTNQAYISVIVGAAAPVITPLAFQTEYGLIGTDIAADPITVSVSPASVTVSDGSSYAFTATLTNDPSNAGVTWSIGSGVGSLSASTTTGVTYNAPAGLSGAATVTLTATSIADPTKSGSATITISAPGAPASQWVSYNSSGNLVYQSIPNTDNSGAADGQDQIMDFSTAGYNQGAGPLPTVAAVVTVSPSGGDDTATIQAAINQVSAMSINATTGFRGAVLLNPGSYTVSSSLLITASGVVLQGSGSGTSSSTNTIINMAPTSTATATCTSTSSTITCMNPVNSTTCTTMTSNNSSTCTNTTFCLNYTSTLSSNSANPNAPTMAATGVAYPLVVVGTCGTGPTLSSSAQISDTYVPAAATIVHVFNATGLTVGKTVMVQRPATTSWIGFMDMAGNAEIDPNGTGCAANGGTCNWVDTSTSAFKSERTITAVNGLQITLDAPIADSIDSMNVAGATLAPYTFSSRISQVGVENLRAVVSQPSAVAVGVPTYQLLVTSSIMNGWARNLTAQDTLQSVVTNAYTKQFTVYNVALTHTVVPLTGAYFEDFYISSNATQVLMDTVSDIDNNMFFFGTSSATQGPNVLRNGTFQGNNSIQPHQRWATGLLVENTTISAISGSSQGTVAFQDRGDDGTGQGWAIGWGVVWNVTASSFTIQKPPGSQNWCIGCIGQQLTTKAPGGTTTLTQGAIDSSGTYVFPTSLYQAQLTQRLGPGYTAQ